MRDKKIKQQIFLLTEQEEEDFSNAVEYFKQRKVKEYSTKTKFLRAGVLKLIALWKEKIKES